MAGYRGLIVADENQVLYAFERGSKELQLPPARRTREHAGQELEILKQRLRIPNEAKLPEELEKLLLRYCTETTLNILWYERARRREQRAMHLRTYLMIGLMTVALGLICVSAFRPVENSAAQGSAVFPFAFLAGGALTVLQVVAGLGDNKARLAIFWKASADLKEALYTFEHKWHGRVYQGTPLSLSGDFDAAVSEELRLASTVTRSERLEFFATLRSPSDVVAVASGAVTNLRAQRAEGTAAASARGERIAAARKAASEARAAVEAAQFRVDHLDDAAEKKTEQAALVKARAEVVRTQAILQELIGG